ncbi:substrate-binding domain-containing protein [Halobium salinum]|uniref:Substrate-binding domain-containing protein n=1 Tax=Halobium salinum TaxID=1364940 RepID=A0ABD5PBG9_9EURY|nr:substrate-binding domain-containing protein [Halobium salinum]
MTEQRSSGRSRRRVLAVGGAALAGVTGLAGCTGSGGSADGNNSGQQGTDGGSDADSTTGSAATTESGGSTASDETTGGSGSNELTVFHAGSLAPPFEAAETQFEAEFGAQVAREAKGSVGSTKKITEEGRRASVLGVSDFRLLRDMLLPDYGDWYSVFATNAMTITYTENSTGADEVGPDNWWEVLGRDDVTFAHSDPAVDPNGYRSVMTMKLGAMAFEGETLYDESTADALVEKARIPSGTETELLAQLQTGKLDYAWQYQSAGATRDVQTIDLQPAVDLSQATQQYADHYAQAEVETESGTFTGAPIAYGLTVPSVAPNPELGAQWLEFMLTEPGEQILKDAGFEPVQPAVVPEGAQDAVPERVMENAEARSSLGPLEL